MPAPKRRAKPCEACRDRHIKCDIEEKEGSCENCRSADIPCRKATKRLRFKNVGKVKKSNGFATDQPWIRTEPNLEFCDETEKAAGVSSGLTTSPHPRPGPRSPVPRPEIGRPVVSIMTIPQTPAVSLPARSAPPVHRQNICSPHQSVSPPGTLSTLGITPRNVDAPFHQTDDKEPYTSSIGLQEACLIRHFTAKLARSFDTTDRDAHYTLTLPHRTLRSPVLLNAICTVSAHLLTSQWYSKHQKPTIVYYDNTPLPQLADHSAIHYHNACLRLLMDFADIPADEANAEARADALAATTILRTYEQLDTSLTGLDAEVYQTVVSTVMSKHHNESIFSLTNMDKNHRDADGFLIPAEGLRTSACLIALRQEIWSVIMYRRPLRLPLADKMDYGSLGPTDDFTWANRVVLWCADVLRFCFGSTAHVPKSPGTGTFEEWKALKVLDDRWISDMPPCFHPLFYSPARPEKGECFPTLWQFNHAHIVTIQHLHLGRMLLALHDPRHAPVEPGYSTSSSSIREQVRESVKVLCGLGLSDMQFQAGMTTAAIGISIGGAFFEELSERSAVVAFLQELEREHAWPTRAMVTALFAAWGVDHGSLLGVQHADPVTITR